MMLKDKKIENLTLGGWNDDSEKHRKADSVWFGDRTD